ncbi:MAG: hypothetical protein OEZ39_19425 [Gammaproteobacteria bacterium]|nr:hypothetical protein [Gammaproteobacteria bacterium]MDH5654037.1 hypothetical protein [Gammaproteobacteria bacterium]
MQQLLKETAENLEKCVLHGLKICRSLEGMKEILTGCFAGVIEKMAWVKPFHIYLDQTKDYIPSYYFDSDSYSQQCLVINNGPDEQFLYLNEKNWNLNDYEENLQIIAGHLVKWQALSCPKNVMAVQELIEKDCWELSAKTLPRLSDNVPADTEELLSWDDKCVLTGTSKENMMVITRQQWDKIVENETWFKDQE